MVAKTIRLVGRPSIFTPDLGDAICERLADGESLRAICADAAMPSKSTVLRWLADERYRAFREQYGWAREAQADGLVDEILDIADNGTNDWMEKRNAKGESTGWQENGESIRRSALRIDARKWLANKLRPKKYGDKIELDGKLTHGVDDSVAALMEAVNGKTRSL